MTDKTKFMRRVYPGVTDCCGQMPQIITEADTGDWEGIKCHECGRLVYGSADDPDTIEDWVNGENHED